MFTFVTGAATGIFLAVLAQLFLPKISDVIGNVRRSRALSQAKALIAQAEANAAALEAAKKVVAAAAPALPTPPANPMAPTGTTGPSA